jgi:predicted nucleic acid-binding protein
MSGFLFDTNTLLDIATADPVWLPWSEEQFRKAGWLAAQAFLKYRRGGGAKTSPLPDFYIGAHAEAEDRVLVTRDPARYRAYYQKLS